MVEFLPSKQAVAGSSPVSRSLVHCLTKNLPRQFHDPFSISFPRFFTSAVTPPGTKNAKHLVPTREKPQMARLGKKRKIPGEASSGAPERSRHRSFTSHDGFLPEQHYLTGPFDREIIFRKKAYERYFEQIIEEGQVSGVFQPAIHPKIAIYGLLGMFNWLSQWYRSAGQYSTQQIADMFVEMVSGLKR